MASTIFKGKKITREMVLEAMKRFDTEHRTDFNWSRRHKYAVKHEGRRYPPKEILSLASGVRVGEFSGGIETNCRFWELGFEVIRLGPETPPQ